MKSHIRKTSLSVAVVASTFLFSSTAFANAELEALKERLEKLENAKSQSASLPVTVGGVVEVEAGYAEDYADDTSSDIVLATAALTVAADVAENVNVQVALLHEEVDTDLEVDEAIIALEFDLFFANAGLLYVPFGSYASNLVSDPLTLDIGETRESAVELGVSVGPIMASAYVFNGDVEDNYGADKAKTEMYGLSFTFSGAGKNFTYEMGADYINSIADTDTLQDTVVAVDDYVAGITVDATLTFGATNFTAEYTTAADEFELVELSFEGEGAKPAAYNVEVGYLTSVLGYETQLAAAYQGTKEAIALELPEKRVAIAASVLVANNTNLSLELAQDTDYDEDDGGTGDRQEIVTLQLAAEF